MTMAVVYYYGRIGFFLASAIIDKNRTNIFCYIGSDSDKAAFRHRKNIINYNVSNYYIASIYNFHLTFLSF